MNTDPTDKSFSQPQEKLQTTMEEEGSTLVSNGCVDIRGRIADKRTTGGWRAARLLIVNEMAERLAFFAIAVNMVAYLVFEMRESLPTAATHVTDWIGAAYVLTLLGAFIADAYLGRFKTIIIFCCIYAVGMVMLTFSAAIDNLRPPPGPPCSAKLCVEATKGQDAFLYGALALIALGTGGIKPCVSSFGADQFDEGDPKELKKKHAFFNWFFFAINTGAILALTFLVYLQDKKGWVWGFAVPTGAMFLSVIILLFGIRSYRFQKPMGSPFTRFLQVLVASFRNHFRGVELPNPADLYEVDTVLSDIKGARKLPHTFQYRFLDKAAIVTDAEANKQISRWSVCTVTQVEEFKCFVRVLPVWASTIALSISFAQLSTFFVSQARIMDRKIGSFTIPAGSAPIFSSLNALLVVPIYEVLVVPFLRKRTGHPDGITSLQRMGLGLFISIFAMASAALVEKKRRDSSADTTMSVFWLFPQFFLMGGAEVFTYVGQLDFFYNEATDGTRSISSAMFLSEIGIGSWLSTAIVNIVVKRTGGQQNGWLRNNLNNSKLDKFYWLLAIINVVNFLIYLVVAKRFKGRSMVAAESGKKSYNKAMMTIHSTHEDTNSSTITTVNK